MSTCIEIFDTKDIKGEFVVIVEGLLKEEQIVEDNIDIVNVLMQYINDGYSKKDAVKLAVKEFKLNKNEVYQKSLEI